MIISTATTQRCCVIQYQYAIITGQTSNRGLMMLIVIPVVVAVSKWLHLQLLVSHFSYPLHILTVTTTTIHQRISHFIRYLYFTQQRRNIHYILWTLRESLMSDVLPLSSWRSIYIGIGEVGGINLVHLASTWCQRHIWRSWSRGTPHHVAQLWQVQFTRHGLLCFRMEDHSSPVQVNRTCPSWATVMIICIKVHSGKLHLPELGLGSGLPPSLHSKT